MNQNFKKNDEFQECNHFLNSEEIPETLDKNDSQSNHDDLSTIEQEKTFIGHCMDTINELETMEVDNETITIGIMIRSISYEKTLLDLYNRPINYFSTVSSKPKTKQTLRQVLNELSLDFCLTSMHLFIVRCCHRKHYFERNPDSTKELDLSTLKERLHHDKIIESASEFLHHCSVSDTYSFLDFIPDMILEKIDFRQIKYTGEKFELAA